MKRRNLLKVIPAIGLGLTSSVSGCLELAQSPNSLVVSGDGEYPHEIRVENMLDRDVTLTITVHREDTRMYQDKHTVTAQTDATVAGITKKSLPEDSRSVTVSGTDSEDDTASVNVLISECLGNIVFFYRSEEKLQVTHSIC